MMKNSLKKKTNKKGFTLVELVMVVALIAILAAIAVPTVTNVIDTANKNVDASNATTVELALKTADAELQAKTWTTGKHSDGTSITSDTLLVSEALKHEGISAIPDSKSGASWSYSAGKVYCDSTHTTGTGGTATALTSGSFVKDVIAP